MKNEITVDELLAGLPDSFVSALLEGNTEKLAEPLSILSEIVGSVATWQLNQVAFQIEKQLPSQDENKRLRDNLISCVEAFRKYADILATEELDCSTAIMGDPRLLSTIIAMRALISQNLSWQVQSVWYEERELEESLRMASKNKLAVFPPTVEAVEELLDNVLKWTMLGCVIKFARQQAVELARILEEYLSADATRENTIAAIRQLQLQSKSGLFQSYLIGAFNACKGSLENEDAFLDH